jgi:hypothetical protein
MGVLAQQTFTKLASSGGGSGSPYTLVAGVTVPDGATYVVAAFAGWTDGNDLSEPPTFGGVAMDLVGTADGYDGERPRSRIFELALDPETWDTELDLVVDDSSYSYVQHGRLLFHNGSAARTPVTIREQTAAASPKDLILELEDAEAGDVAVMAGSSRNTANAQVVYSGNADETGVTLHFPGVGLQFTVHGSYVATCEAGQLVGQEDALAADGGGNVDWVSFVAVAIPQPAAAAEQAVGGTLGLAGSLTVAVQHAVGGTAGPAGGVTAHVGKATAGTAALSGGAVRAVGRALAGTLGLAGAVARGATEVVLTGALSLVGAIVAVALGVAERLAGRNRSGPLFSARGKSAPDHEARNRSDADR